MTSAAGAGTNNNAEDVSRFDNQPVLITAFDGVPVASGSLWVRKLDEMAVTSTVELEFMMRGIIFVMPISPDSLRALEESRNGKHFVFKLPSDSRLQVHPPAG